MLRHLRLLGGTACALLALTACFWIPRAAAETLELPTQLVVQFDATAEKLDQDQIRHALQQELGIPLAASGSAGAPTLTVRLNDGGDLELIYDPERHRASRSVPLTESTNVPELVAQLAGNMVRDEAALLVAELSPPTSSNAPQATPASAVPAPATSPATDASSRPDQAVAHAKEHPWAVTVLLGGGIRPMAFGVLTLQGSRRFGRFELGVALEGALGRGSVAYGDPEQNAGFYGYSGEPLRESLSVLTATLLGSLDVDLLRLDQGYLQLGGAAGYRLLGVLTNFNHVSGSDAKPYFAVRFTAGLKVREQRTLLLRGTWDMVPRSQWVYAGDDTLTALSFGTSIQLGYAMSF